MANTRILVVDDEEDVRNVTRNFFTKRGYDVYTAKDEKSALEIVDMEHPHIILLDIGLGPESGTGFDILRKIRENDANKHIKIIMVTAWEDAESIQKARSLGADDYVSKPFTTDFLNNIIIQKIANLAMKEKH